eukprot:COSAG02_NODE_617_length_19476_cov_158.404913_10_plen_428_part_00
MGSSSVEALERTVDEVDALEAIFGYEEGGFTIHSAAELAAARCTVEAGAAPDDDWEPPQLDLELRVEIEAADGGAAQAARLRCSLPGGYPDSSCAVVSVAMEGVRRATQDALTEQLGQAAAAMLGEEAVMALVQQLQDIAPTALAEEHTAIAAATPQPTDRLPAAGGLGGFGRRWMWAHHIASTTRRGLICKEARSLSLGGYLKPGYPGVVVVEGEGESCEAFVNWMKSSSKHTQAVRGQISGLPAGQRAFPLEFVELAVDDMGGLGERCKAAGLESEFREYVLQHRASSTEPEPEPEVSVHVACCKFHHLLAGNDHQKEKDMVAAAKALGLRGVILYGTPGIVVLEDESETAEGVTAFLKECSRKIGKKGDVTLAVQLPLGSEVGSGTGAMPGGTRAGLVPVMMEELKSLLGRLGQEQQYRTILGL